MPSGSRPSACASSHSSSRHTQTTRKSSPGIGSVIARLSSLLAICGSCSRWASMTRTGFPGSTRSSSTAASPPLTRAAATLPRSQRCCSRVRGPAGRPCRPRRPGPGRPGSSACRRLAAGSWSPGAAGSALPAGWPWSAARPAAPASGPASPASRRATAASSGRSTTSGSSRARSGPRGRRCGSAASGCTRGCCAVSSAGGAASTRSAPRPRPTWTRSAPGCARAGRDPAALEMVGGLRGRFPAADAVADLEEALSDLPGQLQGGFRHHLLQAVDVPRRRPRARPLLPPPARSGGRDRGLMARGGRAALRPIRKARCGWPAQRQLMIVTDLPQQIAVNRS